MVEETRYYIIHPNGRERIQASNDLEALSKFSNHWSAKAEFTNKNGTRRLLKETKVELFRTGV